MSVPGTNTPRFAAADANGAGVLRLLLSAEPRRLTGRRSRGGERETSNDLKTTGQFWTNMNIAMVDQTLFPPRTPIYNSYWQLSLIKLLP